MIKSNIYWTTYNDIEKQVVDLSKSICFCDKQLLTYSTRIADLIMFIGIEIESVIQAITKKYPGFSSDSIGGTVKKIDEKWSISQKTLGISNFNFDFSKNFVPEFKPLDYKNGSSNDYYSTFCALKHNKIGNLEKANINTLIRSLASLYVYTLYYEQPKIHYSLKVSDNIPLGKIPNRSMLFNPYYVSLQSVNYINNPTDPPARQCDLDKAIFVFMFSDETATLIREFHGIPTREIAFGDGRFGKYTVPTDITCVTATNAGMSFNLISDLSDNTESTYE